MGRAGGGPALTKRLVDIVLSALALVVLAPLFATVAVLIKLNSPGPVFFRSPRVGRGYRLFAPFKFRTMVVNAPALSRVVSTPADDPRITRIGRIVRQFNLDELPLFINVLKGEMSIVGPRPEVPQYVAMFTEEQRAILSTRPGITDWATLWIRDKGELLAGTDDPEQVYVEHIRPEKLRLQLEYVRRRTIWIDFIIMAKTFKTHLLDRFGSRQDLGSKAHRAVGRG